MTLPFNCPFCGHDNPRGARFCNECGSPLHLAPCAHCDAVNDVELPACYSCGAPLPRVPHDAETALDAPPLAEFGRADDSASVRASALLADEPAHSISGDVDVDTLGAAPRRDGRRGVMPAALAALLLLVASGAVVGYVAYRQGMLPWVDAAVTPAAPPENVAALRGEAAKDLPLTHDEVASPPAPAAETTTPPETPVTAPAEGPVAAARGTNATTASQPDAPASAATRAPSANATRLARPAPATVPVPAPPRRTPGAKAESPAVDKDAAATQTLIQREIRGFGPPKPPPPRAPPAPPER